MCVKQLKQRGHKLEREDGNIRVVGVGKNESERDVVTYKNQ